MNSSKPRAKAQPAKKSKPPPKDQDLPNVDTSEAARGRSGMIPEDWNAAIRMQTAARDWLGYPVTLGQALELARQTFDELHFGCASDAYSAYVTDPKVRKQRLEAAALDARTARETEQREISKNAGKR